MLRHWSAYRIINFIFVVLIGIVLSYSYFFYPNNQPVNCAVKQLTGKDCPSCGFSRAFSAFTHGEWQSGKNYNPLASACFVFFCVQLVWRLILIGIELKTKRRLSNKLLVFDILFTTIWFWYCFSPMLLFNSYKIS
jgi:hypothetical protein